MSGYRNWFADYDPSLHELIWLPGDWLTIVDTEDAWLADEYEFMAYQVPGNRTRYVFVYGNWSVSLHRLIMPLPKGLEVDHKNRDGLDNRRRNLRQATRAQNLANKFVNKTGCSSQYRGVSWHQKAGKWKAQSNGQYLGLFDNEVDAARARDRAALERYGEFAVLNFPQKESA